MEKMDKNKQKINNKDLIDTNNINSPIRNIKDEKDLLDSHSDANKLLTELENIDNNDKNEKHNDDLSKSLSEINHNNSYEDKKTISIDSNSIFQNPPLISKKIIVEIDQLSQRVSKDENENEINNRFMMKELRLKYFPNNKINKNAKNIKNNYINYNDNKLKNKEIKIINNLKFKNYNNILNNIINNKTETIKKIVKPNLILDDDNDLKTNINTDNNINNNNKNINKNNENIINNKINSNKNIIINSDNIIDNNKLELDKKNKFFINLLKQDDNYLNKIKPITKDELIIYSNEKEKIIFLLEKNRELINILRNFYEKYKTLKNEYIDLYKSINVNNFNYNENDEYKNYLNNENKTLKIKLDNYENIFTPISYYINDISSKLNLKKINFINLKNNINIYEVQKNNKNNPLNNLINTLNENKKLLFKYIEDYIYITKNDKNKDKTLNKIRSFSNIQEKGKFSRDKILNNPKDSKFKMKKYYDKL